MIWVWIVLILAAVWLFRLLVIPYGPCGWCGGTGRNPFSGARRHGDCWFCHGTRRRWVLGAKTARRVWRSWRGKRR